jgi:hypothetical protein
VIASYTQVVMTQSSSDVQDRRSGATNRPASGVCGGLITMKLLLELPYLSLQLLDMLLKLITMWCLDLTQGCGKLILSVVISCNMID